MTSGPGADDRDSAPDRLRRRYPRWRIWRGHTTGGYWALPPRDHPTHRELIGAGDLDELAWRLAGMTASLGAAVLLAMALGRLKDRRGLTPRRSA